MSSGLDPGIHIIQFTVIWNIALKGYTKESTTALRSVGYVVIYLSFHLTRRKACRRNLDMLIESKCIKLVAEQFPLIRNDNSRI
jgi:hypothetical protein